MVRKTSTATRSRSNSTKNPQPKEKQGLSRNQPKKRLTTADDEESEEETIEALTSGKRKAPGRKGQRELSPPVIKNDRVRVRESRTKMDEEKPAVKRPSSKARAPSKGKEIKPKDESDDEGSLFSEEDEKQVPEDSDVSEEEVSNASSDADIDIEDEDEASSEIKPKKRATSTSNQSAPKSTKASKKRAAPTKSTSGAKAKGTRKSRKSERDTSSQSNLIKAEQRKTLEEMIDFFLAYLKDKNEPGITVNSLLKFMKTNSIQGKDRKMEIDENIAERMVLHLLRIIGITPKYSKSEELVVTAEQLHNFVMADSGFHLRVMKKVLQV